MLNDVNSDWVCRIAYVIQIYMFPEVGFNIMENPDFVGREQQRCTPVYAFAQSDQRLYCSLYEKY